MVALPLSSTRTPSRLPHLSADQADISRRLPMGASLICCLQRSRLHRSGSAVASPRSGLRGPRLLADGTRAPDLAQRPVETGLLLVVERIVELLQRRAHA